MEPDETLDEKFVRILKSHIGPRGTLTVRAVILTSADMGISPRRVVKTAERLRLVSRGTWGWFRQRGGITQRNIDIVLRDREYQERKAAGDTTAQREIHHAD